MSYENPANYCNPCGEDFAYLSAFDKHRVGEHDYTFSEGLAMDPPREDGRRCLDVNEMKRLGWKQDRNGRWKDPQGQPPELERVEL